MRLSGWGRFPVHEAHVSAPRDIASLADSVKAGNLIARGNGRAYGDSAVNCANTVSMRHFNRMLAFEPSSGQLVVESGVILGDIIAAFLPRGWFPWVTPGTKFVTTGGMIAADVHGKNHHRDGSFGSFVDWVDVMTSDGIVHRCSLEENPDLFAWTVGGMGLTGVIVRAAIRLRPVETGWIRQTTLPAGNMDEALTALEESGSAAYSVAWIDCLAQGADLGRSIIMMGDHARVEELPSSERGQPFATRKKHRFTIGVDAPRGTLNSVSVRAFNELYYRRGARKKGTTLVDWDTYFYPLDAILGWNRIYGRKGFIQFQCVLPLRASRDGLASLLTAISTSGQGSFLAVLKRLGDQESRFSFPMAGFTLALDFPVTTRSLRLMETLDRITVEHGGRFYLAKDARLSAATLRASDERVEEFVGMRQQTGLSPTFQSEQSRRLQL
jgi:FAD/FMN-containing dehydrogenase